MTAPVVAVVSPAAVDINWPATVRAIRLDGLAHADVFLRTGVVTAALACDAVVAVLPASVGLDPLTCQVWQAAADADLPRAVLITELGDGHADFADLAAIARRALGDECVVAELPVFNDNGSVVATLGVADGYLHGTFGRRPSEREHRRLTADSRFDLLAALAAVCDDDAMAAELINRLQTASPDDPDADVTVWHASDGSGVWQVGTLVATAAASGQLAPVVPHVPGDMTALTRLLAPWQALTPRVALIPCDNAGAYVDAPVAVVIAAHGDMAVARLINGQLPPDREWYVMTRSGPGSDGHLYPYRTWPVSLWDASGSTADRLARFRVSLTPHVGDCIAEQAVWALPMTN